jgi:hypothetical protein
MKKSSTKQKLTVAYVSSATPPGSLVLPSADAELNAEKKSAVKQMAALALEPSFGAATVAQAFLGRPGGELSVTGLIDALKSSIDDLSTGDMGRAEAMLMAQAHAMQAIFVELARRGARSDQANQRESLLRMAFKAQNQCRMTLETLAAVKKPPAVFAHQTNIANGPQQINNALAQPTPSAAVRKSGNRAKRTRSKI